MEKDKQQFEVYAVPNPAAFVLTKEQAEKLSELSNSEEANKKREENAKLFEKINLVVKTEDAESLER